MLVRMWEKEVLVHCWWCCKSLQPRGKLYGGSSKNEKWNCCMIQQFYFWGYNQRRFTNIWKGYLHC